MGIPWRHHIRIISCSCLSISPPIPHLSFPPIMITLPFPRPLTPTFTNPDRGIGEICMQMRVTATLKLMFWPLSYPLPLQLPSPLLTQWLKPVEMKPPPPKPPSFQKECQIPMPLPPKLWRMHVWQHNATTHSMMMIWAAMCGNGATLKRPKTEGEVAKDDHAW